MGIPYTVGYGDLPDCNVGATSNQDTAIILRPNLSQEFTEQTYVHELLHVAWYQSGLDQAIKALTPNQDAEEIIVNALSLALYASIKGGALGK